MARPKVVFVLGSREYADGSVQRAIRYDVERRGAVALAAGHVAEVEIRKIELADEVLLVTGVLGYCEPGLLQLAKLAAMLGKLRLHRPELGINGTSLESFCLESQR